MNRPISADTGLGHDKRERAIVTAMVAAMTMLGGGPASVPAPRFAASIVATGLLGLVVASLVVVSPLVAAGYNRASNRFTFGDGLVVALLILIAAQLVPLPPSIWAGLPGRSLAADIDAAVFGAPGWRTLSLDPSLTVETAIQLLPALAAYLAVRCGSTARCVAVLDGVLIAGGVGLVMGVLQMLFPDAAVLQPYPRGDYTSPTGLFTNHNHQAVFLACLLPLAVIRGKLAPRTRRRLPTAVRTALGLGVTGVLAVVVLATGSRMGAALLLPTIVLTALAVRGERKIGPLGVLLLVAGIGLIGALGGTRLLSSLEKASLASDQRWDFYPDVWQALMVYWPAGAGLGTFPVAFAPHEPLLHLGPHYLNHAHNDYLEVVFEAGAAGATLGVAALVWVVWRMARANWPGTAGPAAALHRLACIAPFILLLHSIFDYPLRTVAVEIVMAVCLALISKENHEIPLRKYRKNRNSFYQRGN